jgi:hypothetical protein
MTEIVVSSNALQRVGSSWSGDLPGSHLPQSTKFGLSKPVCAARSSSIRIFEVITIFIVNHDQHDERQAEGKPVSISCEFIKNAPSPVTARTQPPIWRAWRRLRGDLPPLA